MTESWQRNWRAVKLRCLTWKDKNQQPNSFQNAVFMVWKKCGTTLEANMHDKLLGARKIVLLSCRNDAPNNSNLPRSIWQPCFSFCVRNFTPVQTDLLWIWHRALHCAYSQRNPKQLVRKGRGYWPAQAGRGTAGEGWQQNNKYWSDHQLGPTNRLRGDHAVDPQHYCTRTRIRIPQLQSTYDRPRLPRNLKQLRT